MAVLRLLASWVEQEGWIIIMHRSYYYDIIIEGEERDDDAGVLIMRIFSSKLDHKLTEDVIN